MDGAFVRAAPEQTAKAARIGVLVALAKVGAKERALRLGQCVEGGIKLLQRDSADF